MKYMRIFLLSAIILAINFSIILGTDWKTTEIKIKTSDGFNLYAWLNKPDHNNKAPLFVLLPMMNHTHESFTPFLNELKKYYNDSSYSKTISMPYVLTLDLRGHGKSTNFENSKLIWRDMTEDDFAFYPLDVKEMIAYVLSDSTNRIDTENIIVIGASVGSNTAIMLTELIPNITKVVMLSPGENYRGLQPAKALESYKKDCLIFTGKDDTYSYTSSKLLAKLNKNCRLKVFDGKNHGTNIIDNNPFAMSYLIEWLLEED